jgi:hypothetical protein
MNTGAVSNQNAYLALAIFLRHFNASSKEEHSKQDVPTDMFTGCQCISSHNEAIYTFKTKIVFNL